ncbi:hypothetical protein ACMYSO_25860 (plasmid) [Klebsiella sp. B345]|uniref:hypothetical protein n=1 Tax=Klebsiella sp. B345 TaxID=2755398 RepID=UPI003DA99F47
MLFISSGHIESDEADLKKNSGWAYKSEGFETCIINNEIYMIFGVVSSNGIQFKLENYVKEPCPLQNIERDLKSCSGFFVLFISLIRSG